MQIKNNPNGTVSMFDPEGNIITFDARGKNRTEFYKLQDYGNGLIKGTVKAQRTFNQTHTFFNHEFKCIYFYINSVRITTFSVSQVHSNVIIQIQTEEGSQMLFKYDKDILTPLQPLSFNVNGINMTHLDWCLTYSNNTLHVCIKTKVLTSITEHHFIYDITKNTSRKLEINT